MSLKFLQDLGIGWVTWVTPLPGFLMIPGCVITQFLWRHLGEASGAQIGATSGPTSLEIDGPGTWRKLLRIRLPANPKTWSSYPFIFDHPFIHSILGEHPSSEPATSAPPVARTGRVVPGVQYQEQVKSIIGWKPREHWSPIVTHVIHVIPCIHPTSSILLWTGHKALAFLPAAVPIAARQQVRCSFLGAWCLHSDGCARQGLCFAEHFCVRKLVVQLLLFSKMGTCLPSQVAFTI